MTIETGRNRGQRFVGCVEPWLLGGAMFLVYWFTLYHLPTPATLGRLADLAGWNWGPSMFGPVTFLVTYPIRWLPEGLKLPVLNCFAAACAALVLALLARSVALLPHDRTNEQRLREASEDSLLSIPTAWVPPLFAVLVCGLQLSFWERAVEFRDASFLDSGEMFNLLIFAYVIRCLLEFRISRNESWLTRFAVVYGLGLANNWAMIGFFPCFLVALVWIKGFDFFQWRFVVRVLLCGLAGSSLLLLLPILNQVHHYSDVTFGSSLRVALSSFRQALLHIPPQRSWLLLFGVTSIFPVLLMGIRWASSFGDNSPMGVALATYAFRIGHAFLLLCCLWVSLDPPFSPREMVGIVPPVEVPFLTLYYLGALSVGYLSGYLLLVFGVQPARVRSRQSPPNPWPGRCVVALVWLIAIGAPLFLFTRNLPQIKAGSALAAASDRYFSRVQEALPPTGAVVLADNDSVLMSYGLRARLARSGRPRDDIFIETTSLGQSWDYVRSLDARYPRAGFSSVIGSGKTPEPVATDCIHMLETLAQSQYIYYLHPSFGYYFERFYPEDLGLVYRLNIFPTNSWASPPPPPEFLAENRKFWHGASEDIQFLIRTLHPPATPTATGLVPRLEHFAHLSAETNQFVSVLAGYYSRAANNWGVELARSAPTDDTNRWREAGKYFDMAQQLNSDNRAARINYQFNQDVLSGKVPVYKRLAEFDDVLAGYRVWSQAINDGGPLDEPNFCRALGVMFRQGNNFRQAIEQFERLQTLMPQDSSAPFQLAETYLTVMNHPDALYYAYPLPLETGIAATAAADQAVQLDPNNTNTLSLKALAYWTLGLYIQYHTNVLKAPYPSYVEAFSNSLTAVEDWLRVAPDEPNALFFQSMSLMQLGKFDQAVRPLNAIIAQSNNPVAVLNRAICYFQMDKLDLAKPDYESVLMTHPESYQADFGLGEIAYSNRDFPAAIKYYGLYLTNAPGNIQTGQEYQGVEARLKELKAAPP